MHSATSLMYLPSCLIIFAHLSIVLYYPDMIAEEMVISVEFMLLLHSVIFMGDFLLHKFGNSVIAEIEF